MSTELLNWSNWFMLACALFILVTAWQERRIVETLQRLGVRRSRRMGKHFRRCQFCLGAGLGLMSAVQLLGLERGALALAMLVTALFLVLAGGVSLAYHFRSSEHRSALKKR